jgi:hypothetical protein
MKVFEGWILTNEERTCFLGSIFPTKREAEEYVSKRSLTAHAHLLHVREVPEVKMSDTESAAWFKERL